MDARRALPLVAALTFLVAFGVAELTGVRALGGLVLVAGGLWCARIAAPIAGKGPTAALLVVALVAAFVAWELRAPHPMLPMRFFRSRTFAAANGVGFVMSFGVFGSIFLLAPFLQVTQGLSPLEAGIRTLPWTAMPMLIAPWAGILSDRIGSRPLMATGLALQAGALAWLASISVPDVAYSSLVLPFAMAGAGMALVFAPSANAVLSSVDQRSAGQASGATNAIRELGGVMGIAVLASVFSAHGSYASPQAYTDGMVSAVWVGAAVLAAGALVALAIPRVAGRATAPAAAPAQIAPEPVAA